MVNKLFTITNISIYIITIIICILFLSSTDISQIKNINPFLKFYKKNHSSKLIKSIQAVNSKDNCPKDTFPFLLYTYPGTTTGCLISNNTLQKDSCGLLLKIFKKTEIIQETNEKYFHNILSKKLCVELIDNNDYISNLNNNKYDENKKMCGILDTIGTKYYIDINKDCPINKIIINKEPNINEDFISIELIKDKYYLHYSNNYNENENNNYLLTNDSLIISEGYPCIKPDEINTYHIQYILSKANDSFICDTNIQNIRLDSRYSPLINIQKNELYLDNDIILDNYFDYPFKDVNLTLYQIGYIGTDTLFNNEIIPNINDIVSNILYIYDLNNINQFINRIIYSLIFIIIVSLLCKYFISDSTIYIWNYILLFIILGNLIINIIINRFLYNLGNFDKMYLNKNNDKIFNLQMEYIYDIINESKNKINRVIIGDILLFICVGLFNILNYFIFNNPKNFLLKYKNNKTNYYQNKKCYNSINVLKPTSSFDIKNENLLKCKEEIELPKISNEKEDEKMIDNNKDDEEENNLTNDNYDN